MVAQTLAHVPPLDLDLPAVPESVALARGEVRALAVRAGFADEAVTAVAVAVSEAASNAVRRAEVAHVAASISLRAELDEGDLLVSVLDGEGGDGAPAAAAGTGLGLALIAALATHMEVETAGSRQLVRMRFGGGTERTSLRTAGPRFSRSRGAPGA